VINITGQATMKREPPEEKLKQLESEIELWEKAIVWIAKGWDCSDEYAHDAFNSEELQYDLEEFEQNSWIIPQALQDRLSAADEKFIGCTEDSDLCIWGRDNKQYNKVRHWYYFRWPVV
jgi:hypothetical protein